MSTALPDYPSDKDGRKRTFAVLLRPARAMVLIGLLHLSGIVFFLTVRPARQPSYLFAALMLAMLGLTFLNRGGAPGSVRMNRFVSGSVIYTLSFVVMLMLAY